MKIQKKDSPLHPPVLGRRLAHIARLVPPGARLADIGTDHGRLIAHLAATGRIACGWACDINPKPLAKAQRLVAALGLGDTVTALCCDGLSGITPQMADHIVIAGMGGDLIAGIIGGWEHRRHSGVRYLLSPMTRPEALRGFLYTGGYILEQESCVREGRFVYSVMSAAYTGHPVQPDDLTLYTGAIRDMSIPDNLLYIQVLIRRLRVKAAGIETAGQDAGRWRNLLEQLEQLAGTAGQR